MSSTGETAMKNQWTNFMIVTAERLTSTRCEESNARERPTPKFVCPAVTPVRSYAWKSNWNDNNFIENEPLFSGKWT